MLFSPISRQIIHLTVNMIACLSMSDLKYGFVEEYIPRICISVTEYVGAYEIFCYISSDFKNNRKSKVDVYCCFDTVTDEMRVVQVELRAGNHKRVFVKYFFYFRPGVC